MFRSNIGEEEIRDRIKQFRQSAQNSLSEHDTLNQLVLIFGEIYSYATKTSSYKKGQLFFRARSILDDDSKLPSQTLMSTRDAWEPPEQVVTKQGRLNRKHQSILYCCPGDPHLAINEARAQCNHRVAIMVYRAVRPVSATVIGDFESSELSKNRFLKLYYEFLEEEFSQFVKEGDEGRYVITQAIADTFYNLPEQDAWCYRSVQSPDKYNIAFLPGKQHDCLSLVGVMLCDLRETTDKTLCVKFVVDFDPKTGVPRHHQIGSETQKHIFPDIRV